MRAIIWSVPVRHRPLRSGIRRLAGRPQAGGGDALNKEIRDESRHSSMTARATALSELFLPARAAAA